MRTNRNDGASALGARTTTRNDKADGANVGRVGAGQKNESLDCAVLGDDRKALATLHAMAARELPDLRAVGNLLRQIGGAR